MALSYLVFTFLFFGFVTSSLLRSDYRVLGDSWYIVLLLVDIPKVTILAQFVLASSEPKDVSQIVAKGMYVLAPSLLIDTFGKCNILNFSTYHLIVGQISQINLNSLNVTFVPIGGLYLNI